MSAAVRENPVDGQVEALLEQVTRDRDNRCATLRANADEQVRKIVSSARAEARKSVHEAVSRERTHIDLALRQAKARAEIEARRREQQKVQVLLQQMWSAMAEALEARWRDPASRKTWIEATFTQAAALLSGRTWHIEYEPGWSEGDRSELTNRARQQGASAIEWSPDAGMATGLRIRTEGVCLDATVAGLLAQRAQIEGAFLQECQRDG
jgi:vacuolar-type H+-ATPase subunit E/Vma4